MVNASPTVPSASGQSTMAQDAQACYRALASRDARFDGRFFTGVMTTGIYCRPVCSVRTPLAHNCRFFDWAAQAEQAGFRPCLRCRPELAPGSGRWSHHDAGRSLLAQAQHWLDLPGPDAPASVAATAQRLGISERHLRRLFDQHMGVSPVQYLQTRRLLWAKQMLTDTRLPVTQVALASGFRSVRRFNAAFVQHYRLAPTALRRTAGEPGEQPLSEVRLSYRPPLAIGPLMAYWAQRALPGLEAMLRERTRDGERLIWRRALSIAGTQLRHRGGIELSAMVRPDAPEQPLITLQVDSGLEPVLPEVIRRCRHALDLDADPASADAGLMPAGLPGPPGVRVAGGFDAFEIAVRAILGQQVTLGFACTLAHRLMSVFGPPCSSRWPGLQRLFPAPADLLAAGSDLPSRLGEIGITRQRQQAIAALALALAEGRLELRLGHQPGQPNVAAALQALPGIGPWTAGYIALRALGDPDAWPQGDAALRRSLPAHVNPDRLRPWRGYAAMRLWQCGTPPMVPSPHPEVTPLATA